MLRMRSLLLAGACLFAASLTQAADDPATPKPALDNKVIRVGTAADYPPLTMQSEGQVRGIEADLAAELGKRTGHQYQFKIIPWSGLFNAVERGEVDMLMSGISITAERQARVDFTQPYFKMGQMAIIRSADAARFGSPLQILQPEVRLAYVADSTGAAFAKKFAGMTTLKAFSSVEPALQALMKGEVDCVVHDAVTSWNVDKDRQYASLLSLHRPLTDESLAWAVSKQQPALRQRLDQELAAMQADGTLQRIINRWLPVRTTRQ